MVNHTTPSNLTYAWNFGSLAFLCLGIQIVTGLLLAAHYNPDVAGAFESVEHIMRDVPGGWLIRYGHANGASMFFVVVYTHILRGIYYTSYVWPRRVAWTLGVALFVLLMATAFVGYVLPWGQMSLWGATVITNLISAVPYVGDDLLVWVWGGYSVGGPTLSRFYALHFVTPFVMLFVAGLHAVAVQRAGSSNPVGVPLVEDAIPFTPYYLVKDLWGFLIFGVVYAGLVFWAPNLLGHPDNYIKADPLVTPPHIVPEWYFLPFYAILRAIPSKEAGVAAMGGAILILLALPTLAGGDLHSRQFRPLSRVAFWWFATGGAYLGWLGGQPVSMAFEVDSVHAALWYFLYFVALSPGLDRVENLLGRPYTLHSLSICSHLSVHPHKTDD